MNFEVIILKFMAKIVLINSSGSDYSDALEFKMDKATCMKCNLDVTDKHKGAIECNICLKYLHKNCFATKKDHETASKDEFWICSDDCWNVLPVDKNVFRKGIEIKDDGIKAVYDMMKGVVLSGARQSILHTQNYNTLSERIDVVESNVEEINEKIELSSSEINNYVHEIDKRTNKEIDDLKNQIDRLTDERNSRTLVVFGLNVAKVGNVTNIVQNFLLKMEIDVQLSKCFSIKSKKTSLSSSNNIVQSV